MIISLQCTCITEAINVFVNRVMDTSGNIETLVVMLLTQTTILLSHTGTSSVTKSAVLSYSTSMHATDSSTESTALRTEEISTSSHHLTSTASIERKHRVETCVKIIHIAFKWPS